VTGVSSVSLPLTLLYVSPGEKTGASEGPGRKNLVGDHTRRPCRVSGRGRGALDRRATGGTGAGGGSPGGAFRPEASNKGRPACLRGPDGLQEGEQHGRVPG
jgi:hypothetical protein